MPARRSGAQPKPGSSALSERTNEIIGLFLIGFAVFLAMSLWTFHPGDPSWGSRVSGEWSVRNYGGVVGAHIADFMVQTLGAFSALTPVGLILWGVAAFAGLRSWRPGWRELVGMFLLLSASGLFYKAFDVDPLFGAPTLAGGIVGYVVVKMLDAYVGGAGSWISLGFVFLAALVGATGFSIRKMLAAFANAPLRLFSRFFAGLKRAALKTGVGAAYVAGKMVSTAVNFPSRMRANAGKSRAEPAAGDEDEEAECAEEERNGAASEPLSLSREEEREGAIEAIAAPDAPPLRRQKKARRGGRAARFPAQPDPSLFGGGKFPELELSGLVGPAMNEELDRPAFARSALHGPAARSGEKNDAQTGENALHRVEKEFLREYDGPQSPADEGWSGSSLLDLTTGEERGGDAEDKANDDAETLKEPFAEALSGEPEENRRQNGDSSPEVREGREEEALADEEPAEPLADLISNDVGEPPDSTADALLADVEDCLEDGPVEALLESISGSGAPKNGTTVGEMKVRSAGADGESEVVRIEDESLTRPGARMESHASGKRPSGPKKEYILPSLDIFADPPAGGIIVDEAGIREKSLLLEQTLNEFGVSGKVTEVKTGPVITIFEYDPAPGIKVSKITGLADDLARALSALSVRIVAPIPGKSVVGIEVPNLKRDAVFAKEVFSSREFIQAENKLTMGLGKDILGRTAFTDLATIPHLLIAGTTGSGKSVALNMMICSLLSRRTPREVRFLMIDPKMLELSIYEGIPHQLVPVVTDPKKAAAGLRGVLAEMERRYKIMSEVGVRNIQGYNESVARQLGERETKRRLKVPLSEESESLDFLPYIVVVIDELADLMMVAAREVEESMTRLAQMARASGIHLLVATQRPSVDVLTGLIKANFPSRMALRVATRTDSRTILDSNGAERLLGRGDMLFVPPGSSVPVRIHGAYVADDEITQLVAHWKAQGSAVFRDDWFIEEESASAGEAGDDEECDERYDDAIALVARTREASISLIQRHLRIGYNRAARMIERMEQEGIIGPADGVKRRQVLVSEIPGEERVEAS